MNEIEKQNKADVKYVYDLVKVTNEYLLRFVSKNVDLDFEELYEKYTQDKADREEAAAIEKHRQEVVLADAKELLKSNPAFATILGIEAQITPAEINDEPVQGV